MQYFPTEHEKTKDDGSSLHGSLAYYVTSFEKATLDNSGSGEMIRLRAVKYCCKYGKTSNQIKLVIILKKEEKKK